MPTLVIVGVKDNGCNEPMVYGSMERETAELEIVDLPVELMDAEAGVVVPVKSSVDVSVQVVKFRRIERQDFYIFQTIYCFPNYYQIYPNLKMLQGMLRYVD